MTEFVSLNRVRGKKPGANVLATATGNQASEPALVTHTLGRGRVASVLLGDFGGGDSRARPSVRISTRPRAR